MFSNRLKNGSSSVVWRVTLWSAWISLLLCLLVFTVISIRIRTNVLKQIDQTLSDELHEISLIWKNEGLPGVEAEFKRESGDTSSSDLFYRLTASDDRIVLATDDSNWPGLTEELQNLAAPQGHQAITADIFANNPLLNARAAAVATADGHLLQMGTSLRTINRSILRTRKIVAGILTAMMILSTVSAWLIARRAMAGVCRVTRTVTGIRKNSLDRRVTAGNEGREIAELAEAFNQMLNRIEVLVRELKEVSDNVAHDLRSPITRMRCAAETTLTGPQTPEAYREMGAMILEECDRLTAMINTMLEIAQSESGVLEISRQPVDLSAILRNAADLFLPAAEEKQIALATELPEGPLILSGDKMRLQRTVANLLDNALKYTPPGGTVRIAACQTANAIQIEISDSGIGIEAEELPRIFDRFYRGETSRSSHGNGLGLSLARSIVTAHGGHISVQSEPGKGSIFTVELPVRETTA